MRPTTGRHLSPRQGQVKDGCNPVLAIPALTSLVWPGGNRYLARTNSRQAQTLPPNTAPNDTGPESVSLMRPIVFILIQVINLYIYLLIASAILSWLIAFNVVNTRNQFV